MTKAILADQLRHNLKASRLPSMGHLPDEQKISLSKLYRPEVVKTLRQLNQAHRFVLNQSFTQLAAEYSLMDPRTILNGMALARMPFDSMWIEWPEKEGRLPILRGGELFVDANSAENCGFLIHKKDSDGYHADCVWTTDSRATFISPTSFDFDLADPDFYDRLVRGVDHGGLNIPEDEKDDLLAEAKERALLVSVGEGYFKAMASEHGASGATDCLSIAKHASWGIGGPVGSTVMEYLHGVKGGMQSAYSQRILNELLDGSRPEVNGDFRFLVSILTLLNVAPETNLRVIPSGKRRYASSYGKMLPAYEFRTVTLERPSAEVKEKVIMAGRFTMSKRWHSVMGHRCYSRETSADCVHIWVRSRNKKGKEIGSDRYHCPKCKGKTWWKNAHGRGDKSIGIIDKQYEITKRAPGQPAHRTHHVEKVVARLPHPLQTTKPASSSA